jgi:hypothetical protein
MSSTADFPIDTEITTISTATEQQQHHTITSVQAFSGVTRLRTDRAPRGQWGLEQSSVGADEHQHGDEEEIDIGQPAELLEQGDGQEGHDIVLSRDDRVVAEEQVGLLLCGRVPTGRHRHGAHLAAVSRVVRPVPIHSASAQGRFTD